MNSVARLVKVGVVALAFGMVGCAGTARKYCEKKVACEGGSDRDKDACTDTKDGESDVADDYNCSDQFDSALDCVNDHSTCQTTNDGSTRSFTSVDMKSGKDACQAQLEALASCKQAANAKYY
jgi:hypothetical protein